MAFIDELKLYIKAGDGGDGVVRWKREKYKPKAGPGGGDGGRGGDVYIETVSDLAYLENYQYTSEIAAENGELGGNFSKIGASGHDYVLYLPVGSVLKNQETGDVITLDEVGEQKLLLQGGAGGYGNERFKGPENTTPYESTAGKPGQGGNFTIELQLIADVGLVGLPNAGKSTLLNELTNANSKTASYAFTTLEPHLGVLPSGRIIADIPGLIEGASDGRGLGTKFLRHVARTSILVHLISAENENMIATYQTIRNELEQHKKSLLDKPEFIVLSKVDTIENTSLNDEIQAIAQHTKHNPQDILTLTSFDDDSVKNIQKIIDEYLTS